LGVNENGHAGTLTPVGEGNTLALRHAAYSPRLREPRARDIADALMQAGDMTELDLLVALEIGRPNADGHLMSPAGGATEYRSASNRCW